MLYKNRVFQIAVIVIVLLSLLKPSYTRFKEYSQGITTHTQRINYKNIFNGLIFSIYQKQIFDIGKHETLTPRKPEKYLGFFMNFFKIENNDPTKMNNITSKSSSDSITNAYTSKFTPEMVDNKRDPSCGMLSSAGIDDTAHYKNLIIGFCSKECKDEFLKDPEKNISAADLKKIK